jgi:hypothetical protein
MHSSHTDGALHRIRSHRVRSTCALTQIRTVLVAVNPWGMSYNMNAYYVLVFFLSILSAIFSIHCIKADYMIAFLLLFASTSVGSVLCTISVVSLFDL